MMTVGGQQQQKAWEWCTTPGKRQKLIDATRQLMVERGYSGITMAAIAERAGVNVSSIYNLVKNKDELVHAMMEAGIREVRDQVDFEGDPVGSYLLISWKRRDFVRVIAGEDTPPGFHRRNNVARIMEPWLGGDGPTERVLAAILWEGASLAVECDSPSDVDDLAVWVRKLVQMVRIVSA